MDTAIQQETYTKLKYIRENFIEERMQGHALFGAKANNTFSGTPATNAYDERFVNALFSGLNHFRNEYKGQINTSAGLTGNVFMRDTRSASAQYKTVALENADTVKVGNKNLTEEELYFYEINLANMLNDGPLKNMLNKIRMLYTLLEPSTYEVYKAFISRGTQPNQTNNFKVHKYAFTNNSTQYTIDTVDKLDEIRSLVGDLMTENFLLSTSKFVGYGSGLEVQNLSRADMDALASTYMADKMKDSIIRLAFTSATQDPFGSTREVTLPAAAPTNVRKTLRISFQRRMNMGNGGAPRGQMVVVVKTSSRGVRTSRVIQVTDQWTPITVDFGDIDPSESITVSFRNMYGTTAQNTKSILMTGIKARFLEDSVSNDTEDDITLPIFGNTDLFMVRRVLRMYELLANIYIADIILSAKTTSDTSAMNLAALCYLLLVYANLNISRDIETDDEESVTDLTALVSDRMRTFQQDAVDINVLDASVSSLKMNLKANDEKLSSRRNMDKMSITFMWITLAVMLVVVLVSVGVFFAPLDKTRKLTIVGITFAVAIITSVIVHLVYNKKVEGFYADGAAAQSPSRFRTAASANALLSAMDKHVEVSVDTANDYLTNSIQLALLVSTYRTYGNINFSMMKEKTHYKNTETQMVTTNDKLLQASNALARKQAQQKARIMYFIYLMIIVTLSILALIAANEMVMVQKLVLGIAGVLILTITVMYFMETSGRVHTAGKQYYWAQPDVRAL